MPPSSLELGGMVVEGAEGLDLRIVDLLGKSLFVAS